MSDRQKPSTAEAPLVNSGRRLAGLGLAAGLLSVAGCGGSGGSSNPGNESGGGGGTSSGGGSTPSGIIPPATGKFGGGQGRILFANGGSVFEYDLATRTHKGIGSYVQAEDYYLVGGVSRANDGSFLVTDYKLSGSVSRVYHCDAAGNLLHAYNLKSTIVGGCTLAPDATRFAYVNQWNDTSGFNWVPMYDAHVVDLATGQVTQIRLIATTDPNAPQRNYDDRTMARMVWGPDGTLYGMTSIGLYRVDITAGRSTLLHSFLIGGVSNPTAHPDGREIWFDYTDEAESGSRVGAIDIATGAVRKLSASPSGLDDHLSPSVSPDRQWLLMQDVVTTYIGIGFSYRYLVAAIRYADPPVDQKGMPTEFKDSAGERFTSRGPMAWY